MVPSEAGGTVTRWGVGRFYSPKYLQLQLPPFHTVAERPPSYLIGPIRRSELHDKERTDERTTPTYSYWYNRMILSAGVIVIGDERIGIHGTYSYLSPAQTTCTT
jgi:hypothetical protein